MAMNNEKIASILSEEEVEEFSGYDFPFENLVVEGGGAKCIGVIGMYRVFEELGISSKIMRFAGASGGALFSTLAVIGYHSSEMETIFDVNLKEISEDAWFGILSFIPNLIRKFGMHSGEKLYSWLGDIIGAKTDDPDITFQQLYSQTGKELVITVTNIQEMDCVYFHVKTTPSMSLRKALRMSMGMPGVMQPIVDDDQVYVDGGVLCNYPIKCFDGWFLSMAHEDMFLLKFKDDDVDAASSWETKNRFLTYNKKTVGVLVYSANEEEILKEKLDQRKNEFIPKPDLPITPKTKKARHREMKQKKREEALKCHNEIHRSMKRFVKCLAANDKDMSGTISKEELKDVIEKSGAEFTVDDAKLLFGQDELNVDEIFDKLDLDTNGEISFQELMAFGEQKGLRLMTLYRTTGTTKINEVGQFFEALVNTLLFHRMEDYVQEHDIDRTIGIDTAYLGTMDFDMTPKDKHFLIQQGKIGCLAFLRYFIKAENLTKT